VLPDRLELYDGFHIVFTCYTHGYYRLRTFPNHSRTSGLKNLHFMVGEKLTIQIAHRITKLGLNRFSIFQSSHVDAELSNGYHIVTTWSTHEFYRLRTFQIHPITFGLKKWILWSGRMTRPLIEPQKWIWLDFLKSHLTSDWKTQIFQSKSCRMALRLSEYVVPMS